MKELMGAIINVLDGVQYADHPHDMPAMDDLFVVVAQADSRVIAHVVTVLASIANLCDTVTTSDTQGESGGSVGDAGAGGGTGGRF